MNKKELIKALEPYEDHMDIFLGPRLTDFTNGLLNSVTVKEICFKEDPSDEECMAKDKAIVLSEE